MARIVFALDHEEGHCFPTFKLARQLEERGHTVTYLGLPDTGSLVRRQGFAFVPMLERFFPEGTVAQLRRDLEGKVASAANSQAPGVEELEERYLGALALGEGLDGPVAELKPDLFILSAFVGGLNGLILHLRFAIPTVFLSPFLRVRTRVQMVDLLEERFLHLGKAAKPLFELVRQKAQAARRLRDVTGSLLLMPELIQCPREFDLPREGGDEPNVHYIEASVDLSRRPDQSFPWDRLEPGRKLLYASLGSQSVLAGKEAVVRFLRAIAEGAARHPEWQLVLGTGGQIDPTELPLPADAIALPWVPQISILERAALMVTHGGLGTVKECIFHGVPMVVFPIARDQPDNAQRVVHHGIGLSGDLGGATPEAIFAMVGEVDSQPSFREKVARMGLRFREVEDSGIGVQRIEEVLSQRVPSVSPGSP